MARSVFVSFSPGQYGDRILNVARQQTGPLCATGSKNDPKPGKNGNNGRPCFQRVVSLFSLCYLLLEKSSKSLIPLGDCPFVLNRLPDGVIGIVAWSIEVANATRPFATGIW